MIDNVQYLTTTQAAQFLQVNRLTLRNLRKQKRGPVFTGKAKFTRYAKHELIAWLESLREAA